MPQATILQDYADYLQLERSANTASAYVRDVQQCIRWLRNRQLTWNDANVRQWLLSLPVGDRSRARKLASLRSFAHFAQWPLTVEGIRFSRPLPPVPTVDALRTLLHQMPLADRVMAELLYGTGMRVSELAQVKWSDIRWEDRMILVHGKGRKDRMVLFPSTTIPLLQQWYETTGRPDGESLVIAHARETIARRLERYGLYPHLLRHAMATHCYEGGMDLRALQTLLGHSSLRTVEIYTHVSPQHLHAAYDGAHPLERAT